VTRSARDPAAVADASDLATALMAIAAAVDQARSLGLPVNVPQLLYQACLEIIERYDPSVGPDGAEGQAQPPSTQGAGARAQLTPTRPNLSAGTGRQRQLALNPSVAGASYADVPLRRLIWQVLDPGEEFTVADVVDRLADLGTSWTATNVSNALGYWVSRGRLARQRKGVYTYPVTSDRITDPNAERAQQEIRTVDRATARRKEQVSTDVQNDKQRKAM
jgi:hypothetical protein